MSCLRATIRLKLSSSFTLDCAFEVPPGFTILFGHSGAGKTSLLDCLAGIRRPDAGDVQIGDRLLFHSGRDIDVPPQKRQLAYVMQDLCLFPHKRVVENVCYGLVEGSFKSRVARYKAMLERLGIAQHALRYPGDLSGGERQRVALARSLVTDPCALLLDEPLAALDRNSRKSILDDLRVWQREHSVPVLYVTHSVREALALGERVLEMRNGRIVNVGSPQEVLDPEDWD